MILIVKIAIFVLMLICSFVSKRLQRTYPGVVPQGCSSVSVTLSSMITYVANDSSSANSLFREVDVLAKKYRVSDKRLWHLKVQSLAKSEQWRFLHNLGELSTLFTLQYLIFVYFLFS